MAALTAGPSPGLRGGLRFALAGAVGLPLIFAACWAGAFIVPAGPTHALVDLFTSAPPRSAAALTDGVLWSALFGGFTAALLAAVYQMFRFVDAR